MCAPKAPPAPDYAAAAREQGVANVEAARTTGRINNPNVITPYGTQNVSWAGDQPTVTQTLSPGEQDLYNRNLQSRGLLADVGTSGAGALKDIIGKNLDLSGIPAQPSDSQTTRDQVVNAMMGRVNTDLKNREEDVRANLIAQGFHPGSAAWNTEMDRIDRTRTDALQQAQLAGGAEAQRSFGMDSQLRQQAIAEYLAQRQTPLNEVNALMSGSQVQNPFAQPAAYNAGTVAAPAPLFNAAQAQDQAAMGRYNVQAGSAGGMLSGLMGLGAAAILASDRRLKRDIVKIGMHALGIAKYAWTYLWGERATGVMADELEAVMPAAVLTAGGFKYVNYALISEA